MHFVGAFDGITSWIRKLYVFSFGWLRVVAVHVHCISPIPFLQKASLQISWAVACLESCLHEAARAFEHSAAFSAMYFQYPWSFRGAGQGVCLCSCKHADFYLLTCVFICVCIRVHMYLYVRTHEFIYVTDMYACMHAWICVFIHVCVPLHRCVLLMNRQKRQHDPDVS